MGESFRVSINPQLLVWARTTRDFDVDEIAKAVGVKPETLVSWEAGEAMPTWKQLKALANKTKRPVAAFYLPSPPAIPKKPKDYRTSPGVEVGAFSPDLLLHIREARGLREQIVELLESLDEPPRFPELPLLNIRDSAQDCADTLRHFLGVTIDEQIAWVDQYAALNAWRETLFDQGVLVVQLPIHTDEARGFSENHDVLSLVVVSSQESAVCARIFTIIHELCHLCLRRAGVSDPNTYVDARGPRGVIERFCDGVAGRFLVPMENNVVRATVRGIAQSGRIDLDELRRVSNRLKVSQSAIVYRMVEEGMASREEYRELLDAWQSREERSSRSVPIPVPRKRVSQLGRRYTSIVLGALDTGVVTTHEACKLIGIKPKWLDGVRNEVFSGGAYA